MHLVHDIPPRDKKGVFRTVVECPAGTSGKFEINKEFGIIGLDRYLAVPMAFPFDYGFIPGTWSPGDDDPVDIMVMNSVSTFPSCLLYVRIIGMYKFIDGDERDYKVLAVCADDKMYSTVEDLKDISVAQLKLYSFFWKNYKSLTKRKRSKSRTFGWGDKKMALEFIEKCIKHYHKKFDEE